MANLFEAIVLGTVQGITEFLPISSTAHLIIVQRLFGLNQEVYGLTLDLFTSLGTTIALIFYFRKDLKGLIRGLWTGEKLPWWILGVTALVAVAGILAEPYIEGPARSIPVIATGLIVFGLIMLAAEKYATSVKQSKTFTKTRTYLVGLSQILAFIPGVSRSGATISTGLFLGMDRVTASRLSFILSTPIFLAAIAKRTFSFIGDYHTLGITTDILLFYFVSALVAGIVGYLTIHYLLQFLQKHSLSVFVAYRFALALVILIWLH